MENGTQTLGLSSERSDRCDELRKFIALFVSHKTILEHDVVKKAKLSKAKLNDACQKTKDIPFCEPGAAEKVDYNTLRVVFYKLVAASEFSSADVAQIVMASKDKVEFYLDSIRSQVENG
jgi:arsenate reductase-like glutaredoxin family protein